MNIRLLSRSLCQPWAMRPLELSTLTQLIIGPTEAGSAHVRTTTTDQKKARVTLTKVRAAASGTATGTSTATVIPIWGVLGRGWEDYEKYYFDAVDVDDLIAEIEATPPGSTIILWFRSPGGIVTGIPEMAAYLRSAVKRRTIIAFTDDLCASAAYWLASQCSLIVATPTAELGSIGVYIAFYDWTTFLEKQGISLELFKAGRMKAMGMDGNPLSDEESALLQDRVDATYDLFTGDVLRNRELDSETMQGQTFSGRASIGNNLADVVYPSFAAFSSALAAGKLPV